MQWGKQDGTGGGGVVHGGDSVRGVVVTVPGVFLWAGPGPRGGKRLGCGEKMKMGGRGEQRDPEGGTQGGDRGDQTMVEGTAELTWR